MSIRLMSAAWDLDIPSCEKMVLMCLCDFADDEGGNCWPSVATLSRKTSKSERTIQAAIRSLEGLGYLQAKERKGTSNAFQLNPRKICTPAKSAPPQKTTNTPATVAPHPRNGCTQSTKNHQEPPIKRASARVDRPVDVSQDVWADFLTLRRTKRAPLTPTALAAIQREVDKAGWTLPDALTECVSRGWQGFKADWVRRENVSADTDPFGNFV